MQRFQFKPFQGGLIVGALCALALTALASTAQASPAWRVKGTNVTAELSPSVSVKEIEGKDAAISSTILGVKTEFLCTTVQPISVKLKPEGVVGFESKLKFTGCVTKLNGSVSGLCEPRGGGSEPGVFLSNLLKGQIIEHEKAGIVRLEPSTGEEIASLNTTEECAIGQKISLRGKLTLKDSSLETEAETHLFSVGPLTALTLSGQAATATGSMIVQLAGAHAGLLWSGALLPVPPPPELAWWVKGAEVNTTLKPLVTANEIEGGDATLLAKVAGAKVEVLCTETQLSGISLESKGVVASGSRVSFTGCITKINEKLSGVCEPANEGAEPGAIVTKSLKGSVISIGGTNYVRLEPTSGETVAIIEATKECSIGEKISLIGKAVLTDPLLSLEAETHLVSVGSLSELWLISKTEEHKVTMDGSAIVRLASTHAGLLWSAKATKSLTPAWRVKGTNVTTELSPSLSIKEIEGKDAAISSTILGQKTEFLCTTVQPISVKLKPEGAVGFESQLKFTGCVTKINGSVSGACEPRGNGSEPGVFISNLLKGQMIEHEKAGIVRLEPNTGEEIASLNSTEECAIGQKIALRGKLTLKDSSLETEAVTHLFTVGPLTTLTLSGQAATATGSMIVQLAGAHAGLLWSGTL